MLPRQHPNEYHRVKRVTLALIHFLFSLRRVYKSARVTRVGGLPHLRTKVTLAGGLTISLLNTPGRVTRLPRSLPVAFQIEFVIGSANNR